MVKGWGCIEIPEHRYGVYFITVIIRIRQHVRMKYLLVLLMVVQCKPLHVACFFVRHFSKRCLL